MSRTIRAGLRRPPLAIRKHSCQGEAREKKVQSSLKIKDANLAATAQVEKVIFMAEMGRRPRRGLAESRTLTSAAKSE